MDRKKIQLSSLVAYSAWLPLASQDFGSPGPTCSPERHLHTSVARRMNEWNMTVIIGMAGWSVRKSDWKGKRRTLEGAGCCCYTDFDLIESKWSTTGEFPDRSEWRSSVVFKNCASPREAGILANFRVSVFVRPLFWKKSPCFGLSLFGGSFTLPCVAHLWIDVWNTVWNHFADNSYEGKSYEGIIPLFVRKKVRTKVRR